MEISDSPRTRPAGTETAEPHDPGQQDALPQRAERQAAGQQGTGQQGTGQQSPVSLDPRLWPRPYVDQPAGGSRRMPRFTPRQDPASPDYDQAADASTPPLPQRPPARPALPAAGQAEGLPVRRPLAPPAALPPGRPAAGRAPVPPPPTVSRGARPQPVRAVIGDEIRIPFIWCEFGTCDATYTHPDALGERDLRARALAAGWRYDALGRRACPDCAQHDPTFWTARPPAPARDWRRAG